MVPLFHALHPTLVSHPLHGKNFYRGGAITCATDTSRAFQELKVETIFLIQIHDSLRRLVREDDGAFVCAKKLRQAHLIRPGEILFGVLGKLDIIGGIRINEIIRPYGKRLEVLATKLPAFEYLPVGAEVFRVVYRLVSAEGDVELPFTVEAAKPVVARSVQVIEKLRRLLVAPSPAHEQRVEPLPVSVVGIRVVTHAGPRARQTLLEPGVKVHERCVNVVQERPLGSEAERDGKPSAERLHEPALAVLFPIRPDVRDEPPLAARPLERRRQLLIGRADLSLWFASFRFRGCGHSEVSKRFGGRMMRTPYHKREPEPAHKPSLMTVAHSHRMGLLNKSWFRDSAYEADRGGGP